MEWWGYTIIGILTSIIGFLFFRKQGNTNKEILKNNNEKIKKEIEIDKKYQEKEKKLTKELVKEIDLVLKEKNRDLENLDEKTKKIYKKYIANPNDMLNRIETIISRTKKEIKSD